MYHKSKCSPHKLPSNLGTGTWNPKDQERVERNAQKDPQKTAGGDWDLMFGGEYAPFLIPSYTTVKESLLGNETSLYFVMSTWNPYQVVLMRTRVRPNYISEIVSALILGDG